ncbi:uncharacterized protein [Centruroides vittatus]|uniref:uncharacterized protein n=1 Tax=Centruroides vittatus TaxID=120091 RepID=UPI00350EC493
MAKNLIIISLAFLLLFVWDSNNVVTSIPITNFKFGTQALCDANLSDEANDYIWKCVMTYYEPLTAFYDCIDETGTSTFKDYLKKFCSGARISYWFKDCLYNNAVSKHHWMSCRERGLFKYCLKKYQLETSSEENE